MNDMERRSRSQTRRNGEMVAAGQNSNRHASSSRLPETSHGQLSLPYSRPPEQARTLSPDRRDRYRASYREGIGGHNGPTSLPGRADHYPTSASVPHSNSNSYNQYNHPYPLNPARFAPGGEAPPPRPLPPSTLAYNNNNNNPAPVPPRPDPPTSYNSANSASAKTSMSGGGGAQTGVSSGSAQHQVIVPFLEICTNISGLQRGSLKNLDISQSWFLLSDARNLVFTISN